MQTSGDLCEAHIKIGNLRRRYCIFHSGCCLLNDSDAFGEMDREEADLHSDTQVDWFSEAIPITRTICGACHSAGAGKARRYISHGDWERFSRNVCVNRRRVAQARYHRTSFQTMPL